VIVQNPISFAGRGDRPDVNQLLLQPIAQDNLADGWYVSMGDFTWSFDWKQGGEATIPLALQLGRRHPAPAGMRRAGVALRIRAPDSRAAKSTSHGAPGRNRTCDPLPRRCARG
jgi:hypothetical protein